LFAAVRSAERWRQAHRVDTVKLGTLHAILTGGECDPSFMIDTLYFGGDDELWVIEVPAELVQRLANLTADRLRSVGAEWAATEELSPDFDDWPSDAVHQMFHDLAALCGRAVGEGKTVLMGRNKLAQGNALGWSVQAPAGRHVDVSETAQHEDQNPLNGFFKYGARKPDEPESLAQFCDDSDVLAMVQFRDERFALWRQARSKGKYDQARFAALLRHISDWNLFLAFNIIDGCTAGKSRQPLSWLFDQVGSRVQASCSATDIL